MFYRYKVDLTFNDQHNIESFGDDLKKLIVHTMIMLECDKAFLKGTIHDNQTGQIVHRCLRDISKLN